MPPTITSIGRITLGGTQFTCDPEPYEPFNWAKRVSVHPVLGGKVIIQDFGLFAADNTVRLGSGSKYPLDTFVSDALFTKYKAGGTHTFTDWMTNAFVVFIRDFRRWPNIVGPLYYYDMELQVISISLINGAAYTD